MLALPLSRRENGKKKALSLIPALAAQNLFNLNLKTSLC